MEVEEGERAGVRFLDVTEASGLTFEHDAGRTSHKHLPETMGHGVALFDFDEDGDLDVYLVQGGALPGLEGAEPGPVNRLYANLGDGRFEDRTQTAGAAAHDGYGMGVAVGDADGDGRVDLFVPNYGADVLLLGDGEGDFREGDATLADRRWTTGAAFLDAELDGDLDLYVAAYVSVDLQNPVWCGRQEEGWRTVCHPDRYDGLQDRFYRNDGEGSFADVTEAAGLADSYGKGLGVAATDLDGDGLQDLYVANDSVENRLWKNLGDGGFRDETLFSGTGVNGIGVTEAGMGVASGDLDGDGDFELYVTNFDHESHTLYLNEGDLAFSDRTASAGLDAPTRMPVGFGVSMRDFDDDGDLDLAVVNGHIVDLIHLYHDGQTYEQPGQLFLNEGAFRFRDVTAGVGDLARPVVGRGSASGDLDGDGDADLVVTECGGVTRLLRNEDPGGRAAWLAGAPRGARILALRSDGLRLVREVVPEPSYLSQGPDAVHLGLRSPSGSLLEIVELSLEIGGVSFPVELVSPLGPGRHRLGTAGDVWIVKKP